MAGPWTRMARHGNVGLLAENAPRRSPWQHSSCCVVFTWGFRTCSPKKLIHRNYAKRLDIGYLDHPPMVAWLIHLGTAVFGDSEFGVRFFALVSSLVAGFFVFRLTSLLYDRRVATTALLLQQVLPFFFMTGFMTTPDAPLPRAGLARFIFWRESSSTGVRRRGLAWARASASGCSRNTRSLCSVRPRCSS